jgi:hypothetical protein
MDAFRHLVVFLSLLSTVGTAASAALEGDWVSYRDAYSTMMVFEKYGQPKHLIQNQYQAMSRDGQAVPEGMQLSLQDKTGSINFALDPTGRIAFPWRKAAYDENAALVLNRKGGRYVFRARVSIIVRADGVYEAAHLRAACEQALAYQRKVDGALGSKRCAGVRFVYPKGMVEPGVRLHKGEATLPVVDGAAFPDDAYTGFRVVNYRFDTSDKGQVMTQNTPLAISPIFD